MMSDTNLFKNEKQNYILFSITSHPHHSSHHTDCAFVPLFCALGGVSRGVLYGVFQSRALFWTMGWGLMDVFGILCIALCIIKPQHIVPWIGICYSIHRYINPLLMFSLGLLSSCLSVI